MTCRPFVMERVMMSLSPSCEVAATVLARRPGPRTVLGSGLLCFGPGCANQPVCVCELVTGCVWIGGQRPLVGQGEDQLGASLAFGLGGMFSGRSNFAPAERHGPIVRTVPDFVEHTHGDAPVRHGAGRIGLRDALELRLRLRVPEIVFQGDAAVE